MKPTAAVIALLFLLAAAAAAGADERVYVGKIVEVSPGRIAIGRKNAVVYIGFYGEAKALERLADVRVGDEVRAVFGTGTPQGATETINKLVDIRRCAGNDRQCAADGRAEDARDAMEERARAVGPRQDSRCSRALDEAFLKDPRYVAPVEVDGALAEAMRLELNSFVGPRRDCAHAILAGHQAAVFDTCVAQGCGERIGGGCGHLAGYAVTDAAIRHAVLECRAK